MHKVYLTLEKYHLNCVQFSEAPEVEQEVSAGEKGERAAEGPGEQQSGLGETAEHNQEAGPEEDTPSISSMYLPGKRKSHLLFSSLLGLWSLLGFRGHSVDYSRVALQIVALMEIR